MVLGAHKERRILLENNPHLSKLFEKLYFCLQSKYVSDDTLKMNGITANWVPIAIPFSNWTSWPAPFGHPIFASAPIVMPAVMKFYDSMSGFTCPPSHIMGKRRAMRKFPQLDEDAVGRVTVGAGLFAPIDDLAVALAVDKAVVEALLLPPILEIAGKGHARCRSTDHVPSLACGDVSVLPDGLLQRQILRVTN